MPEWNDLHGARWLVGLQYTAARLPSAKFVRLTSFAFCLQGVTVFALVKEGVRSFG